MINAARNSLRNMLQTTKLFLLMHCTENKAEGQSSPKVRGKKIKLIYQNSKDCVGKFSFQK